MCYLKEENKNLKKRGIMNLVETIKYTRVLLPTLNDKVMTK